MRRIGPLGHTHDVDGRPFPCQLATLESTAIRKKIMVLGCAQTARQGHLWSSGDPAIEQRLDHASPSQSNGGDDFICLPVKCSTKT